MGRARAEDSTLRLAGAGDGGLRVAVDSTRAVFDLTFEAPTTTDVRDAYVCLEPLTGPRGAQVPLVWRDSADARTPLGIRGLGERRLTVGTLLPDSGEYTGRVTVLHGGRRRSVPLTVLRSIQPSPVSAHGVDLVTGTTGAPRIRVVLTGTRDAAVALQHPTLLSLSREGARGPEQAPTGMRVLDRDGNQIARDSLIGLAPGQPLELDLEFADLDAPGRYSGRIQFASPGHAPVSQAIALQLRDSAWTAALWIALGAVASLLMKWYGTTLRPQLVRRRRARLLVDAARALGGRLEQAYKLEPAERQLIEDIATAARGVWSSAADPTVADATLAEVDALLAIVPDFIAARVQLQSLAGQPGVADLLPFRERLAALAAALRPSGQDRDRLRAHRDEAVQLLLAIQGAGARALAEQIAALRAEIDERLRVEQLVDARQLLDAARRDADAAAVAIGRGEVELARPLHARARGDLARALALVLLDRIAHTASAPGILPERWEALRTEWREQMQAALTPASDTQTVAGRYQELALAWVRERLAGVGGELDRVEAALRKATALDATARGTVEQLLADASTAFATAQRHLAAGALRDADLMYAGAVRALAHADALLSPPAAARAARAEYRMPDVAAAGAAAWSPLGARVAPFTLELVARTTREPFAWESADAIAGTMQLFDLLVWLVSTAVAVGLGLFLLWTDNPVWGGWRDYIVAGLWGLGVYQASGAAFDGIGGLRTRFLS